MSKMLVCPTCATPFDAAARSACDHGHDFSFFEGIPLCFTAQELATKVTADPGYTMTRALEVAADMERRTTTFREAVDRFFEIREEELGTELSREKGLITQRTVGSVNESVAGASELLARMGKPFPAKGRHHIDVGCGLGFGLAASSRSYFGEKVIGLDLSPHYLVLAERLLAEHGVNDVLLCCADICDRWPIPLEHYDVAFISMEGVLEHIKDLPSFFANVQRIQSFPTVMYMTVPYRWTIRPESHFNLRFISWLPRPLQDRYIAWRLGVPEIDHVEFYSVRSMRRLLSRYLKPDAFIVAKNSNNPMWAHYLRAMIYIEGPQSFRAG